MAVVTKNLGRVRGDKGEDGQSAYQIWLSLGNTGTEQDFIDYLRNAADTVPDAFSFGSRTNVAVNTVTESDPVTITGLGAPASISVTGGEYAINSDGYTNVSGSIANGDTVKVRHTSASSAATNTSTTLNIGGLTATFTTSTAGGGGVSPI